MSDIDYRDTPRARYHRDSDFHALVEMMRVYIHRCQFSPSELRDAALLAAVMYEEARVRIYETGAGDFVLEKK